MRRLVVCSVFSLLVRSAWAQGGPPMITDDPGTPGDGRWEINLAVTFRHQPNDTLYEAPGIDLNYGLGKNLQLTLQGGPLLLKRDEHSVVGGLGATQVAIKWRFLDEEKSGLAASIAPRVIFNLARSSSRRGLTADGTHLQIPFQFSKTFGNFRAAAELGGIASTVARGAFVYGIVGAVDVSETTSVAAELHGASRPNFSDDVLAANVGIRRKLNEHCALMASLGHELRSPQPRALIGFAGIQLLY